MSYLSNCEMCTGQGSGGYAPLESIASGYSSSATPASYSGGSLQNSAYSGSIGSAISYSMQDPGSNTGYSSQNPGPCSGYSSNPATGYSLSPGSQSQSALEYKISNSEVAQTKETISAQIQTDYRQKRYNDTYLTNSKLTTSYTGDPAFALKDIETKFIGDSADIAEHIEKAFKTTTGESFPDDIIINVCSKEQLKRFHGEFRGIWSSGINGFAVNRKSSGQKSEIFVCQGQLSNVMATIGHEIGHCISTPLENQRDEEAKAFAFEFAWLETINKENIAGLKGCFSINQPAKNNVHDKAFDFVSSLIKEGLEAISICFRLISKELSIGG